MGRSKYTEFAAKIICIAAVVLLIWFLFEYALAIVLPFAAAFCIGVPIYYLSLKLHGRYKLPRKLCAFVLLILFLLLIVALGFVALNRLFVEAEELIEWVKEDDENLGQVVGVVFGYVGDISSKIPFIEEIENIEGLENFRETIDQGISNMLGDFITGITSSIPSWVINIVKHTPKVFITIIVTLLSCFYFGMDYGNIKDGLLGIFSTEGRDRVSRWTELIGNALKRYAKAYLLIMFITFIEVFVGLLALGKRYAFILALIVAIVDILPVFGAGTVLIPWAIISLFMKDFKTGLGLLILYGTVTIIRQIIEPKIIGESLGIHPLITLFAMFAGLSLFGIPGMLLAPGMVLVGKEVLSKQA